MFYDEVKVQFKAGNGGDGCVIARHLHNAGKEVTILLAGDPSRTSEDMGVNLAIARKMGIPVESFRDELLNTGRGGVVVVDAILGTGFRGTVREQAVNAIEAINRSGHCVVAIDLPSGLDCDTGEPANATVRAGATITFVMAKAGFSTEPNAGSPTAGSLTFSQ